MRARRHGGPSGLRGALFFCSRWNAHSSFGVDRVGDAYVRDVLWRISAWMPPSTKNCRTNAKPRSTASTVQRVIAKPPRSPSRVSCIVISSPSAEKREKKYTYARWGKVDACALSNESYNYNAMYRVYATNTATASISPGEKISVQDIHDPKDVHASVLRQLPKQDIDDWSDRVHTHAHIHTRMC